MNIFFVVSARFQRARAAMDGPRDESTERLTDGAPSRIRSRADHHRASGRRRAQLRRPRLGEDGRNHRRDEVAHGACARERHLSRGRRDDGDAWVHG